MTVKSQKNRIGIELWTGDPDAPSSGDAFKYAKFQHDRAKFHLWRGGQLSRLIELLPPKTETKGGKKLGTTKKQKYSRAYGHARRNNLLRKFGTGLRWYKRLARDAAMLEEFRIQVINGINK